MKKRLLSMLMAVLMIASLVPAAALADNDTKCWSNHENVFSYEVDVDAAAKQPGVTVKVCNDCGDVLEKDFTAFAEKADIQKCAAAGHNWKTVELQPVSCTNVGVQITYCATCGSVDPDTALDVTASEENEHVFSDFTVVVKPTCENDGWGYAICQNCKNPQFIANAADAVEYLPKNHTYAQELAVKALFGAVNPDHQDYDKLVAVTADDDDAGLKAATKSVHSATVGGLFNYVYNMVPYAVQGMNTEWMVRWDKEEVDPDHGGLTYTGDKTCPYCNYVAYGTYMNGEKAVSYEDALTLDQYHARYMTVSEEGYYPYLDKAGNKHDGKTDTIYCDICKAYFGGETLKYDEFYTSFAYNEEDAADGYIGYQAKIGDTFTIKAVAPTCTVAGWTQMTITYTDKGWAVTDAGEEVAALGHNWVKAEDVAATCTEAGIEYDNVYYCSVCKELKPGSSWDQTRALAPLHSSATAFEKQVVVEPTCATWGLSVKYCKVCGQYETNRDGQPVYYYVPAVAHVAGELQNVKEATCTEVGYTGDTFCKFCGVQMSTGKEVPMKEHTSADVEAVDPTCTEAGSKAGTKCSVCGEVLSGCEEVPALGHQTEVKDAKEASCTEAGYTGDTVCTVCGEEVKGEEIPALGHKFANGICTVCGVKDPTFNPFPDVAESSPYYEAILWAYNNDITTGKLDGTFGVNDGCTRAQIVTFLYRQAGSPEVSADVVNPFTDVSADSVYYKAIMWAVSEGITKGTTATTFDPNAVCTRGQIVTFLFRASGDEKVATTVSFNDVAEGSYCYDAVAWAVANGVTKGFSDTTFAPNATCTRGQAVTFIYRANAE